MFTAHEAINRLCDKREIFYDEMLSLMRQSDASRKAAELASIRYREGTVDYLVLLDAERERLSAEDAQAQGEVDLYRGIVSIYKALGGGWQPETVASAH